MEDTEGKIDSIDIISVCSVCKQYNFGTTEEPDWRVPTRGQRKYYHSHFKESHGYCDYHAKEAMEGL